MIKRVSTLLLAMAGAAVILGSVSLDGQSGSIQARVNIMPGTDSIKAFIASRVAKGFTAPKTAWGDPDISGVFTTKHEANTPMERPDEWAGRRMDDITPKELSAAVAQRQLEAVERAPFAGGGEPEEGVAIAVPIHWFDNLAAVNARPWWVIDPADGKIPPLTPEARNREQAAAARQEAARKVPGFRPGGQRDHYNQRGASERCITFGGPFRTPGIYGNSHQILQTPDFVVFRYEMVHEARIIPLDGRPYLQSTVRPHFGDSRGFWDGNSLVVESTNYHPDLNVRGSSGKNLRVVERFTRIAPDKVEWTVTLDDPTQWSRPWTYSYPMTADNSQSIFEYACHEGNYGMANLLTAGRLAEGKAQQAR
jgi:hypothetical protein